MNGRLLAIVVWGAVLTRGLAGQATTGILTGRVAGRDDGRPVADAVITVTGAHVLGERTTRTNDHGLFVVPSLPPGPCRVVVRAIGFQPVAFDTLAIPLGSTADLGVVTLQLSPVTLDPVTVTASERPAGDPTGSTIGGAMLAREYGALPVGRDYRAVLEMLPFANASYYPGDFTSILGATGHENLFFVDGVNLTDPWMGGPVSSSLPYNFVRAVEVKDGGLDAETGGTVGGITDAVSYSGGDRFDGSLFGFYTGNGLTQDARVGAATVSPVSFANYDLGVRLGGPIAARRLWYSIAWNPQVESAVQGLPGLTSQTDRRVRHLYAGKLNWQTGGHTQAELSVFGERSRRNGVAPSGWSPSGGDLRPLSLAPLLAHDDLDWTALALHVTREIGSRVALEAHISGATFAKRFIPASAGGDTMATSDYIARTLDGGVGFWDTTRSSRVDAAISAILALATHRLTAGASFERAAARKGDGYWTLAHIALTDTTDEWDIDSTGAFGGRISVRTPTLYAQDIWSPSSRVTARLGLRWSRQTVVSGSRVVQTLADEWQPRIAVSWRPSEHDVRLFGSWAIVYQQQPLSNWANNFLPAAYAHRAYATDPRTGAPPPSAVYNFGIDLDSLSPRQSHLTSDNYSELTLGGERSFGKFLRLSLRGVHRALRGTIGYAFDLLTFPQRPVIRVGTPGEGILSTLPRATRDYDAIEVGGIWDGPRNLRLGLTYVLSHTRGNYIGYYDERGFAQPGELSVQLPMQVPGSSGDLPNDRRHVVKLTATWPATPRLTLGTYATWESGTPLNQFKAAPFGRLAFAVPRGTAGRLPSLWDLNLRLTYTVPGAPSGLNAVLDIMHALSPRKVVYQQQQLYLDGGATRLNPAYGLPLTFQAPMQVRLGFVLGLGAEAGAP